MNEQKITIQDIARESGVSKTTISRYLNGKYEFMSEETRRHIEDVIEKSGYRRNKLASSLKTRKSELIGVVMSNIGSNQTPKLLGSICDACATQGKNLIVVNSQNDAEKEKSLVLDLLAQRVEGLLVISGYNYEFYQDLDQTTLPVVLADRVPKNSQMNCVEIDHEDAVKNIMSHLLEQGFEQFVVLSREHRNPYTTITKRIEAAKDVCRKHFGNDDHCRVVEMETFRKGTTVQVEVTYLTELLQKCYEQGDITPTAVIVVEASTMSAVACSYYRGNVHLSDHFTIAGYCEWDTRDLITPQISTIEQPLEQMGSLAAKVLISRIEGKENTNELCRRNSLSCRIILSDTLTPKQGSTD